MGGEMTRPCTHFPFFRFPLPLYSDEYTTKISEIMGGYVNPPTMEL